MYVYFSLNHYYWFFYFSSSCFKGINETAKKKKNVYEMEGERFKVLCWMISKKLLLFEIRFRAYMLRHANMKLFKLYTCINIYKHWMFLWLSSYKVLFMTEEYWFFSLSTFFSHFYRVLSIFLIFFWLEMMLTFSIKDYLM